LRQELLDSIKREKYPWPTLLQAESAKLAREAAPLKLGKEILELRDGRGYTASEFVATESRQEHPTITCLEASSEFTGTSQV
jgi:hypothetical protein